MTPATDGPKPLSNRLVPFTRPVVITSEEPARPRGRLTAHNIVLALVALGFVLRLLPLVSDRCLWIDEAMLALNLVERSPAELLKPLDWNQGAPAGFLLLSKASILVLGQDEWALRFVPFVGSVLGMFGFAWLARRMLPTEAAVIAVALFAISPFLISYSAECKQYATDAALTVGLFAISIGLLHGEGGFRRWAWLAVAGAVSVWFSHPVAFVLGGIGTALFLKAVVVNDRRRIGACVTTIGCWLASFGVCYLVSLKDLGNNQFLIDYWTGHFLPLPPKSLGDLLWLADHYFGFLAYPGGLGGTEVKIGGIAAALFLIGLVAIGRERWPVAVALIMPALLALFASALNKYPFAGRLLLFLVPLMLLGVARGMWVVASELWRTQPFAAAIFLGLLLLAPAIETYQTLQRPPRYEQITPVIDKIRDQWQPGDKVYIYYGAKPAFTFYTRENPFPPGVVFGERHRGERTAFCEEMQKFAGEPRVWLLFSHRHEAEESLIRAYAESLGRCDREIRYDGAAAYLFDFSDSK
jgi:hypothetical protein